MDDCIDDDESFEGSLVNTHMHALSTVAPTNSIVAWAVSPVKSHYLRRVERSVTSLVDATDHCSPKPPDTKTVSSPSPSHYWTTNPL